MNKKVTLGAISVVGLIVVVVSGWLVYVHFAHNPAADVSILKENSVLLDAPKPVVVALPTPSTTSTKLEMPEHNSDEEAMNAHWLSKINELRLQKKLTPLVFDSRLAGTAKI